MEDQSVVFTVKSWGILNVIALEDLQAKDVTYGIDPAIWRDSAGRETDEGCLPGATGIPVISKPQKHHCCNYY